MYDLEYKKHFNVIKEYLETFTNLILTGRQGTFKYTNQDQSLEMGILAARKITKKQINRYNEN